MLKKLRATLGIGLAADCSASAAGQYNPYEQSYTNNLYNLLFCDDLDLFKNEDNTKNEGIWPSLLADHPDKTVLRKIAYEKANEGRVRALAYNRLRAAGEEVPPKKVFGVIVEVRLKQGLDVLASFAEGGVRYLNQSGKIVIFEGDGNPVEGLAKELVAVSHPVVNRIGPWEKQRLPPPKLGNVRMTFLVSDGLYFGEGTFEALQHDEMAGPVLAKATELLQRAVEIAK